MRSEYIVEIDEEVAIFSGWAKARRSGVVRKIGPKLVHIDEGYRIIPYIRETQQRRDGNPGFFQTMAQVTEAEQKKTARESLRKHGVEVMDYLWTGPQLAALALFVETTRGEEDA